MKRRDFFQMMGRFVAGCALAVHAVSRLPQKILNPAWVNAPYEMSMVFTEYCQRGCKIFTENETFYCYDSPFKVKDPDVSKRNQLWCRMHSQVDLTENICETQPRFDANGNRVPRFVVG